MEFERKLALIRIKDAVIARFRKLAPDGFCNLQYGPLLKTHRYTNAKVSRKGGKFPEEGEEEVSLGAEV